MALEMDILFLPYSWRASLGLSAVKEALVVNELTIATMRATPSYKLGWKNGYKVRQLVVQQEKKRAESQVQGFC
jgi:hypothetical protein